MVLSAFPLSLAVDFSLFRLVTLEFSYLSKKFSEEHRVSLPGFSTCDEPRLQDLKLNEPR